MKKVKVWFGAAVVGVLTVLSSCLESPEVEDPAKQIKADIAAIDNFLIANPPNGLLVKDPSGVRMDIEVLGTKLPAKSASSSAPTTVDVDYVGRLFSNGVIFDQGNVSGVEGKLSNLIDGWKIAFTTLPVGSVARLYVPSSWAYGKTGQGTIPPNAILIFDVEFHEAVITSAESQKLASDTVAIDDYLGDKGINAVKDTSGIRYVITQQGSGAPISWYSKLTIKFTYRLLTSDTNVAATVDQVPSEYFYSRPVDYVHGLKVGLQKLNEGSKATFYIPSGLGFGTLGATNGSTQVIPPNSNIIVEVEVTDVAP